MRPSSARSRIRFLMYVCSWQGGGRRGRRGRGGRRVGRGAGGAAARARGAAEGRHGRAARLAAAAPLLLPRYGRSRGTRPRTPQLASDYIHISCAVFDIDLLLSNIIVVKVLGFEAPFTRSFGCEYVDICISSEFYTPKSYDAIQPIGATPSIERCIDYNTNFRLKDRIPDATIRIRYDER